MVAVMIRCPKTGVEIPTGFGVDDPAEFAMTIYAGLGVRCRSCGSWHAWSKDDAFLH
jgi:hypothetical protein